jgi:undecaprenyl-diphosphatase
MPTDLTIFAAKYLVFIDALFAVALLLVLLYRHPRADILRWAIAIVLTVVIAGILAKVGAHLYSDPRPFTQDHVRPLISHAPDNGFPSDHALLAAAIAAAVLLIAPWWVIPFAILGFLVDWARVGAGIHHVADVLGSTVFVAIGVLIAWWLAPMITDWLLPHLPASWAPEERRPAQAGR